MNIKAIIPTYVRKDNKIVKDEEMVIGYISQIGNDGLYHSYITLTVDKATVIVSKKELEYAVSAVY